MMAAKTRFGSTLIAALSLAGGAAHAGTGTATVAQTLDRDGQPLVSVDGARAEDTFAALGALTVKGRLMRDSEMGHEGYRPELAGDPMQAVGERWLDLLDYAQGAFLDQGRLRAHVGGEDEAGPAAYAEASYLYHMHHSAGRFEDLGLYDDLTHQPSPMISQLENHLVNTRHEDGRIHGAGASDAEAFAYGMDALHASAYAWVRQDKPGGADDMGQLDLDALAGWLGHSRDDLVAVARAVADRADEAWDADAGIYVLDEGAKWSVDQLGALLRGHKGLYEMLALYGDDADRERAETLADRAAAITTAVLDGHGPLRDWGLPARLEFVDGRAMAASDEVDVGGQWRFVHQVTGGFSILRERDGTSGLMGERHPELEQKVGRALDRMFLGALEYQLDGDYVPARLDHGDGSVSDPTVTTRAAAAFVQAVGNGYRAGDAFDRPGAWDDDAELAERSEALYDAMLRHGELVSSRLVRVD
ncbi:MULTISPECIES: hypothetical protein [unclassified Thioalkalivibrio]|uniref:hypothetical protein n=1 Tax=unclassified Thioalkalivibrio TaxID=2621013 RepID=UPI0003710FDE|nr:MULTISPECIES: hypothetical protein [unclassified Thioalkalivibrio]